MSTSGFNSPYFRFNNLDNDREEDRKPGLCQEIVGYQTEETLHKESTFLNLSTIFLGGAGGRGWT